MNDPIQGSWDDQLAARFADQAGATPSSQLLILIISESYCSVYLVKWFKSNLNGDSLWSKEARFLGIS
ncbi:MAG: hypothetical protein M1570_04375 [Chloroflexi bacterium]|nr:hypothetical protein [Chloroflexota bacterium]